MTISESNLAKSVLKAMTPVDIAVLQYMYDRLDNKVHRTEEMLELASKEDCGRLWKMGLFDMSYVSAWKACGWTKTKLGEEVLDAYYDLEMNV